MMPDENAFDLLPRIKKLRPELPIIVMSAQNTFMTAIGLRARRLRVPAEALRPEGTRRRGRPRPGGAPVDPNPAENEDIPSSGAPMRCRRSTAPWPA